MKRAGEMTPLIGMLCALVLVGAVGGAAEMVGDYLTQAGVAYRLYQAGDFDAALAAWQVAEPLGGEDRAARAEAIVGQQNCLIKLKRDTEAASLGAVMAPVYPDNYQLQINTAYACFQVQRYAEAATHYERAHAALPEDPTALSGLAWCHYFLGDRKKAMGYAEAAERLAPSDTGLQNLIVLLKKSGNYFSADGYFSFISYKSPIKKLGHAQDFAVTWNRGDEFSFTGALSLLTVEYRDSRIPQLRENDLLGHFTRHGDRGYGVTVKGIASNDPELGNGMVLVGRKQWAPFYGQASWSEYDNSRAFQGGVGFLWTRGRYRLDSLVEGIVQRHILFIRPDENYLVFTQKHSLQWEHMGLHLNYVLGPNTLMVRDQGFVVMNTSDRYQAALGGGISYRQGNASCGYSFNWTRGQHMPLRLKFSTNVHTLHVQWTW